MKRKGQIVSKEKIKKIVTRNVPVYGRSIMHMACGSDGPGTYNFSKVKEILKSKNNRINDQDQYGFTPLFFSLMYSKYDNKFEIIKALLDGGADVNIQTIMGNTILHSAVFIGKIEYVKMIVEKGVDINIKNNNKKTALDIACEKDNKDIYEYLKEETESKL